MSCFRPLTCPTLYRYAPNSNKSRLRDDISWSASSIQCRLLFRHHLPRHRDSHQHVLTVMFTIGRLPGWISHWKETMENERNKFARPRQIIWPEQAGVRADRPADEVRRGALWEHLMSALKSKRFKSSRGIVLPIVS